MFNKYLFCEVFESKPSLYYNDDQYHVKKIGSFISSNFDVVMGNITTSASGSVTVPRNATFSQPVKIGDIIQVIPVNFSITTTTAYNIPQGDGSQVVQNGNLFRRCFVVKSADGDQLVLMDYFEYMLSFVNVGYVGNVYSEKIRGIFEIITRRDLRAFSSKLYNYKLGAGNVFLPFATNIDDIRVSFRNKYENTNVTPFSVMLSTLQAVENENESVITLGSFIDSDPEGFYVVPYILEMSKSETIKREFLRIKPGENVKALPLTSSNAATVWIQPFDNSDDYIRAGLLVCTIDQNKKKRITTIDTLSGDDFRGFAISSIPSILIGYSELLDNKKDEDATEEETKQNEEDNKNRRKRHETLTKDDVRGIVADVVKMSDGVPIVDNDRAVMVSNLLNKIKAELEPEYSPLEIEISENGYYSTNNELNTFTNYTIFWDNRFGVSITGANARCSAIRYTSDGRKYTLQTRPEV